MNLILKLIFLLQLVLTFTGEVCAQEPHSPSSKIPTSENNEPVHISADHIIQGTKKDSVLAWGRVKVQHQGRTLRADKVMINNKTGIGKAQGHVSIVGKDELFSWYVLS